MILSSLPFIFTALVDRRAFLNFILLANALDRPFSTSARGSGTLRPAEFARGRRCRVKRADGRVDRIKRARPCESYTGHDSYNALLRVDGNAIKG